MFEIQKLGSAFAPECHLFVVRCFCGHGDAIHVYHGKETQELAKDILKTHFNHNGGYEKHLINWTREAYG